MNQNYDILPIGAADEYEKFLMTVRDALDGLMEQTNNLGYELDDHDINEFTRRMEAGFAAFGNLVTGMSEGLDDITQSLLRELDEKNDIVSSQTQSGYIDQIRKAAEGLKDITAFREPDLGGQQSFSEDQKEAVAFGLQDLREEWENQLRMIQREAEALSSENEQNELSGTYSEIAGLFDNFLNQLESHMNDFGTHFVDIEEEYSARKNRMNAKAQEDASSMLSALNQQLEESTGDFGGFIF